MRDLMKVLEQERHAYSDPVTEVKQCVVVYKVCVCVCVFIKLHITAQSGPVSVPLALILPRGDQ